ncbi:MAG: OsmC family protein [Acidobacteriota bacterium]|nr:OsmC family protein [Acidobacteriota bacterium]MDE2965667.1 OsmC family protein [Acidobacteriota bacterium]
MGNTVQIRIDQTGAVTSTAQVRDHRISVDRPLERGGENQGPMGGELILVGLGGCFTSNLLAAICARQAPVYRVSTTVTATLAENPSRFAAIDLAVSADCSDAAVLHKLVAIAERGCIAANTLRNGVKLTVRVTRS